MPVCEECNRTVPRVRKYDGICDACRMRLSRGSSPAYQRRHPEQYRGRPRFDLDSIPTSCPKCGSLCSRDGYPDEVFCYNCGSTILPFIPLPPHWVEPQYIQPGWTRLVSSGYTINTLEASPA